MMYMIKLFNYKFKQLAKEKIKEINLITAYKYDTIFVDFAILI